MEKYVLSGTIYQASHEAMDELMRAVLGDLESRPRLYGYDILFETENLRLFCHTTNNDGKEWTLNADFKGSLPDLTAFLARITQQLIDAGFNYAFGYVQIDEDGNEIGEEISLYHPDFDALYAARNGSQ
jgi:hypothetical protein